MNEKLTAYFNGSWMPYSEVAVHPSDRGLYLADAVFDASRTFDGTTFRLREHIERLYRSLKYVRIDPGLSADELTKISNETVERNREHLEWAGDFVMWQWVTRGRGTPAAQATQPTVCVRVEPVGFGRFADGYDRGAHAVVTPVMGVPSEVVDPRVKSFNRLSFSLAELYAHDVDPNAWPLMVDRFGALTEGVSSNVFAVRAGTLLTPPADGILEGISRRFVVELALAAGYGAEETTLRPYDLQTADEVFLAGTSPCIVPITQVNNVMVGDGAVGSVTRQLLDAWSKSVGVDIPAQAKTFAARER